MTALRKEHVLVVDDEPEVLVALDDLLSSEFIVIKAANGADALRVVQQDRDIAVVVTDQRMPNITGDELIARLRSRCDAHRIMLTGFADLAAVVRAVNEGRIFAYVTKPWSPEDLLGKVSHAAAEFRLMRAMANERRLFDELMDNVPDGLFFKDEALRFSRGNRSFAAMMGVENPVDLVAKSLRDLGLPSEEIEHIELEERQLLVRGGSISDHVAARTVDERPRWFSTTKTVVRDERGRPGVAGVVRDVTDRVTVAEALRLSEARLREQSRLLNSVLEGMSEGVVVADAQLGLVLFNGAAQKLLGHSHERGSMRGWTARFGLCALDTKRPLGHAEDPLARAVAGERTAYQEVLLGGDVNAERRLVLTGVPLLDPSGACWGGIVTLRDVTERRGMEERLAHSHKMEAVGTLASGVAHDFNNLLSIIRGYAHVVVDSFATEDPRRDDMEELLAASGKASELTQQLLAVGGRHDGKPRPVDINDVVASVERMMSRVLPGRVHLQTRLGGASPVFVDPGKMEQVLLNLIVNARDAIEDEGVVTVATRRVPAANRESGTRVELLVEDTGCGMSPEVTRRIFEPFFTTKEPGKGTGLGLATAFALVKQAGGTLEVDSEPGRGARFRIQLPIHADDRAVTGRST